MSTEKPGGRLRPLYALAVELVLSAGLVGIVIFFLRSLVR